MKIVKPSATLLWITPDAEKMIERAGRVAYKSEDLITEGSAGKFIHMIIEKGHEAVIEHASASILFVCDRGVTHEMVRHRIASYVQESTRYCNYGKEKFGKEITVIQPPFDTEEQVRNWTNAMRISESAYLTLIDASCKPQIARSVLPTCLKTEIIMTANFREWRHFFKLRTAPAAHPQMREIAKMAAALLVPHAPTVFADFIPF
jgi:thymidylate synthase (FAD)